MHAGTLIAAYAYEVAPKQETPFSGGLVQLSQQLQDALDRTFERSNLGNAPAVTFAVDTDSPNRSHPIRDEAVLIAFEHEQKALAVKRLASRLAASMDHRSKPALLLVSVHESSNGAAANRRLIIWTFPQEEVFNLTVSAGAPALEMLEAFNRQSKLRKAALIEGPNQLTGMLQARVLDFQSSAAERSVADLWIVKFLEATLQMSDSEGTQLLAGALRVAHKNTKDNQLAQDQIAAAISALRLNGSQRISLSSVSSKYLTDDAAVKFDAATRPEERSAMFVIDHSRFDDMVQYRRFTLANGIVVSAPFLEIGKDKGVTLTTVGNSRVLKAEGAVTEEQVRTRAS